MSDEKSIEKSIGQVAFEAWAASTIPDSGGLRPVWNDTEVGKMTVRAIPDDQKAAWEEIGRAVSEHAIGSVPTEPPASGPGT